MSRHQTLLFFGFAMLGGCAEEPPPRSVNEFMENPIILEAAMIRCGLDRSGTRYEAECVNARAAVARIQAKEEAARAAELEARSESKRKALRRTQAAAAEARRRTAEAERLRREAEYLAQFGVAPTPEGETPDGLDEGNLPLAVVPDGTADPVAPQNNTVPQSNAVPRTAPETVQAPEAEPEPEPEPPSSDLESIRDELRRRNDETGS